MRLFVDQVSNSLAEVPRQGETLDKYDQSMISFPLQGLDGKHRSTRGATLSPGSCGGLVAGGSHAALRSVRIEGWNFINQAQGHCCPKLVNRSLRSLRLPGGSCHPRPGGWISSDPRRLHHLSMRLDGLGLELEVCAVAPDTEHDDGKFAGDGDLRLVVADLLRQPDAPVL